MSKGWIALNKIVIIAVCLVGVIYVYNRMVNAKAEQTKKNEVITTRNTNIINALVGSGAIDTNQRRELEEAMKLQNAGKVGDATVIIYNVKNEIRGPMRDIVEAYWEKKDK